MATGKAEWAGVFDIDAAALPQPLSSFIGRDAELREIRSLLDATRLLTLTGAGGIGKTRLAIETARAVATQDARRVAFVELAGVSDGASVPHAVASAVGVGERPGRLTADVLVERIGDHDLLLGLDNCEHLIAACAALVERLLMACPALRVLTTTREPLRIGGELVWRVPSLSAPVPGADASIDAVLNAESVRLFLERARAVAPTFAPGPGELTAIVEVCRRLDGIALAIELAAARVRSLSVRQISERLDDRFRLLVGGSRTAPARQQTLAAALDWSYQLLDGAERSLLGRLSVFAGGCTLEAVEHVCSGGVVASGEVLERLTGLVDRSLVLAEDTDDPHEPRFRMLETIRQFASERLVEAGEASHVRDQHLAWSIDFAETAAPHLVGPDQLEWLRHMARERDNFLAALDWSKAQADGEAELRLVAALGRFWHLHGPSSEGRTWLRHALAQTTTRVSTSRAEALNWAGRLATVNGDLDDRELLEGSIRLARVLGDTGLLSVALRHLSMAAQQHGDPATARTASELALNAARQAGNRREEAFNLISLGAAAEQEGDTERARRLLGEGLAAARQVGDAGPIGWALSVLGAMAVRDEKYEQADAFLNEALGLARPMGYWAVIVASLAQLSGLARARGDLALAREYGRACLGAAQEVGDAGLKAAALACYAELELDAGFASRAVALIAAEQAWRSAFQTRRFVSFWSWPAPDPDAARARLDEQQFAVAWAAGERLTLDSAIRYALEPGLSS